MTAATRATAAATVVITAAVAIVSVAVVLPTLDLFGVERAIRALHNFHNNVLSGCQLREF